MQQAYSYESQLPERVQTDSSSLPVTQSICFIKYTLVHKLKHWSRPPLKCQITETIFNHKLLDMVTYQSIQSIVDFTTACNRAEKTVKVKLILLWLGIDSSCRPVQTLGQCLSNHKILQVLSATVLDPGGTTLSGTCDTTVSGTCDTTVSGTCGTTASDPGGATVLNPGGFSSLLVIMVTGCNLLSEQNNENGMIYNLVCTVEHW